MRNRYEKMPIFTEKMPSKTANLLIDFRPQQMYNIDKSVGKLIYYSIHFIFCQERNKNYGRRPRRDEASRDRGCPRMHRHQYARSRFETSTHAMRQGTPLPLLILSFQSAFVNTLDIILCYNAIGFTGKRPRIGLSIPRGLFFCPKIGREVFLYVFNFEGKEVEKI